MASARAWRPPAVAASLHAAAHTAARSFRLKAGSLQALSCRAILSAMVCERLKERRDFLAARDGARAHRSGFVLQLRDRMAPDAPLRIGFTVTKKIGNAVTRNRIKRRLRAACSGSDLPATLAGFDAVLIARQEAVHQPFDALKTDLVSALNEASPQATRRAMRSSRPVPLQNGGRRATSSARSRPATPS